MGCHFLLQGIFLTQRSSLRLLHWKQILHPLSHHGSPPPEPTWHCQATIYQLKKYIYKFWLWHIFTLGVLREFTAIWSSVCLAIQWRESNPWAWLTWRTKQARSVRLKCSARCWHREEPSNRCQEGWQGSIVGFAQGENQERPHPGCHIWSDFWKHC